MTDSERNIVWHQESVSRHQKEELLGQKGKCLWFTGLSGSGKSTMSSALANRYHQENRYTVVLDGDNVRHGLCKDLGFGDADRSENIRRIAEVTKLFVDNGAIVLTAFISPFVADRQLARDILGEDFVEIYIDCPLEECEKRDPKGLYVKARKGEIPSFTGISSPYEAPVEPELHLQTADLTLEASLEKLYNELSVIV